MTWKIIVALLLALAIVSCSALSAEPIYHTVKSGDSLYKIANMYGTTVEQLTTWNKVRQYIYPGQKLVVGYSKEQGSTYVVRSGDTLWKIAMAHGTTVAELKSYNNLTSDMIYVGQVLNLGPRQPRNDITEEEYELLVRLVTAEAMGEPYNGQVAVAEVVLNRARSPQYPDTVRAVMFQRNQFEPVLNGSIWSVTPTSTQYRAVDEALNGSSKAGGALFFFNPRIISYSSLSWFRNNTEYVTTIGNHEFRK